MPTLLADGPASPVTIRPETLEQGLSTLSALAGQPPSQPPGEPVLIAGGTDIYPARVGQTLMSPTIDLSALTELSGVSRTRISDQDFIRIGAMTRWAQLRDRGSPLLAGPAHDALAMAAAEVGGRQIQNRATLGGNLCNASPAADGVPVLLALNASVVLSSTDGSRILPVDQFITGPRRTVLRANELLEAILIPDTASLPGLCHSAFLKLGQRRYLVISAAMVAISLRWSGVGNPVLEAGAVAVGSCGPAACRLAQLEQQLRGLSPGQLHQLSERALNPDWLQPLRPITDMRASAAYRTGAVDIMIRRCLAVLSQAPGQSAVGGLS